MEHLLDIYRESAGYDFSSNDCFVFFDEIQYLKDWEKHVKAIVDTYPSVKCVVSGSAAAALKMKSNESGAGRFTDFLLPPLTFHEYFILKHVDTFSGLIMNHPLDSINVTRLDMNKLNDDFIHYINFGGYPEVIFSDAIQSDPARFIKSDIIDKVLLRDLPSPESVN